MDRNFTIAIENNLAVVLVDFNQGRTVTSDADKVIEDLKRMVAGGKDNDEYTTWILWAGSTSCWCRMDSFQVSLHAPQVNDQACQK